MTDQEFEKKLKAGLPGGVYYFYGEEQYKKAELLKRVRASVLPAGLELMNETVLEGADMQRITDEASALPFMSDRRLVLAKDPPFLIKAGTANANLAKEFDGWAKTAPDTAIVIVYLRDVLDKKQSSFKTISTSPNFVEFNRANLYEAKKWIASEAKKQSCEIDDAAAELLAGLCSMDMSRMRTELDKLCSYRLNSRIAVEDIDEMVSADAATDSFKLFELMMAGNSKGVYGIVQDRLRANESEYLIFSGLLSQLRYMAHTKALCKSRDDARINAFRLGAKNSYPVEKAFDAARSFDLGIIAGTYRQFVRLDNDMKQGKISSENALNEALVKLEKFCQSKATK